MGAEGARPTKAAPHVLAYATTSFSAFGPHLFLSAFACGFVNLWALFVSGASLRQKNMFLQLPCMCAHANNAQSYIWRH